jgi:hypothetical protein
MAQYHAKNYVFSTLTVCIYNILIYNKLKFIFAQIATTNV